MVDSLEWFWETDRVVAVLHVAGARGAAIHQLITYSPEVDKKKDIEVSNGAAHINQEGLGYIRAGDEDSQYQMYEKWSADKHGSFPRSVLRDRKLRVMRDEIKRLITRSGDTLPESVAKGYVLTYRNHPSMDEGGRIWPNRRVVVPYHASIGRSIRDWYEKGLAVGMPDWQSSHLRNLGIGEDAKTVLDYYTICHGNLNPDRRGHKEYLRNCIPTMASNQSLLLSHPGAYVVNVDEFFVPDWLQGYLDLCRYCGITPNTSMAAEFMDKYLDQQWSRR